MINLRSAPACMVPLSSLWIDPDGTLRACDAHQQRWEVLRQGVPGPTAWRESLREPWSWGDHRLSDIWQCDDITGLRGQQASRRWPDRCLGCRRTELRQNHSLRMERNTALQHLLGSQPSLSQLHLNLGHSGAVRHLAGDAEGSGPGMVERLLQHGLGRLAEDDPQHLQLPKWIATYLPEPGDQPNHGGDLAVYLRQPVQWLDAPLAMENLRAAAADLELLSVSRGDALAVPGMDQLLETLLSAGRKDCALRLRTMLTSWPDQLMQLLPRFDDCEITLQIDGHGAVDEWLRYQTHWHVTTELLDRSLQLPNVKIRVHTNVNALNAPDLPRLIAWLRDVSRRHQRMVTWTPIVMQWFTELSLQVLPWAQRLQLADQLRHLRTDSDMQWPLFCWDGLQQVESQLRDQRQLWDTQSTRLARFLDHTQALRQHATVRHWLGYGADADWRQLFPHLEQAG